LVRRGEFDHGADSLLARKLARTHATAFHERKRQIALGW
jgi:hypothetical protein